MTKEQFHYIKGLIRDYMDTLDVERVKQEFYSEGLLNQNTKLSKGTSFNYGLELLPSVLSGANFCHKANSCKYTCIAFSGVGNILTSGKMFNDGILTAPLKKRARRSFLYINEPIFFTKLLTANIAEKHHFHQMMDQTANCRLNVFSDIDWSEIYNKMSDVQFYSYSKWWERLSTDNHHITYSVDESTTDEMILEKLKSNNNVAIVFTNSIPLTYLGFPVIDGDLIDDRYNDPKGVIVGLRLKNQIKGKDNQGIARES
jgi:hypothetical protein